MKCDICKQESKDWHYVVCKDCKQTFDDTKREFENMDTEYDCVTNEYIKKRKELAIYKKALELACESVGNGIVYKDIGTNQELNAEQLAQMFIEQAKKKLEE